MLHHVSPRALERQGKQVLQTISITTKFKISKAPNEDFQGLLVKMTKDLKEDGE